MNLLNGLFRASAILFLILFSAPVSPAQQGNPQGPMNAQGQRPMRGGMHGQMNDGRMQDMQTIHALFAEHQKIRRTIKKLDNGVETVTESDDPNVQALIAEHAWAMQKRLASHQPIRMWDPLFAELFKNADKIKLEVSKTAKGVKVIETSTDAYVVKLIQAHAEGVSEFAKEGMAVMHKSHDLPGAKTEEKKFLGKGDGITTCPVTGEPVNKAINAVINGRTVYFCCPNCRDTVKAHPELYLRPQEQ